MISAHCRDLRSLGFRIDHTLIQYDIGSFYNGPQINELFLLGNRITSRRQICMGDHQLLYALTICLLCHGEAFFMRDVTCRNHSIVLFCNCHHVFCRLPQLSAFV